MKVRINFKVINPEYSQEYANEYQFGKESESNWKYGYTVRYEIEDVKSISLIENEDFLLKGKSIDGIKFELWVPEVIIYRCYMEDGDTKEYAVSKSVINKTHQAGKKGITYFYFYINQEPQLLELGSNFINCIDIPEERIKNILPRKG